MSLFRHFNTRNAYTIEELFNVLRNYQFSAGVPSLEKEGVNNIITFPALGEFNQVRIMPHGGRVGNDRFTKWTIIKVDHKAGLGNFVRNRFLEDITDGWTGFLSTFGSNASEGYKQVDAVLAEIQSLNL